MTSKKSTLPEQLRLLCVQTPLSAGAQFFVATVVVYSLGGTVGDEIYVWAAALVSIASARLFYAKYTLRGELDAPERSLLVLSVLAGLSGLNWGVSGWLYLDPADPERFALICFSIGALLVGSSTSLAMYFPAFLAFNLGALGVAVAGWAHHGGSMMSAAIITLFYLFSSATFARRQEQSLVDAIRLRQENEVLAERLAKEKDIAEVARAAAEQANSDKSAFLAAASHDLRQPVHAQSLYLEVLSNQITEPEARSTLDRLLSTFSSLRQMLDVLLDISRLDAGKTKVVVSDFAVQELLAQLRDEFEEVAKARGLTLRVHDSSVWVKTDKGLLLRLVRNLLENAARYTESGRIVLGFRRGSSTLGVWDTGCGFDEGSTETIFQEYVQLGNPERDREKGLGLGLSIVRRLSQILGAQIVVKSKLGRGAFFGVQVERAEANVVAERAPESSSTNELVGRRVLVVEDDQGVRAALQNLAEQWGMKVWSADSVPEVESLRSFEPELCVLDYRLPGDEDGVELATRLRRSFPRVGILLVTGDTDAGPLERAEALGFVMLHKPVAPESLKHLLCALLEERDHETALS